MALKVAWRAVRQVLTADGLLLAAVLAAVSRSRNF